MIIIVYRQPEKRSINQVWDVVHHQGNGPHLKIGKVLEPGRWTEFDPFLVMMEDRFQQGTFDFHPHRGMETVTYVIDGKLKHEDNQGGYGILEPGDVQWMTAGNGIIHSEDPLPGETVHSLQLWVNLAKKDKMATPRYQDIKAVDAPLRQVDGGIVRVFSGSSAEVQAQTMNHVPVTYVEMILDQGASITQDIPSSYNGFLFILEGNGFFGSERTRGKANQVLWWAPFIHRLSRY